MAKKSVYLPKDVLLELQKEARRQDRSVSWLLNRAWKIAQKDIKRLAPNTRLHFMEFDQVEPGTGTSIKNAPLVKEVV